MENFNEKTTKLVIAQFFGSNFYVSDQIDFEAREATYFRWLEFGSLLLDSDQAVHLWPNSDFRWGYQTILNIQDFLCREHADFEADEFVNARLLECLQAHNPVQTVNMLIEGAKIVINEAGHMEMSDDDKAELMKDLNVMLVLAKMIAEYEKIEEKLTQELEGISLGELEGPKKAKRKPLMEAA